jgi:hypothetical protein
MVTDLLTIKNAIVRSRFRQTMPDGSKLIGNSNPMTKLGSSNVRSISYRDARLTRSIEVSESLLTTQSYC